MHEAAAQRGLGDTAAAIGEQAPRMEVSRNGFDAADEVKQCTRTEAMEFEPRERKVRVGKLGIEHLIVMAIIFVAVIFGVVYITQGQRRIPTQSAKHVRGRRVYGGNRQYLPLRVNQAGVMPIIFASSLLLFPQMFFQYLIPKINLTIWLLNAVGGNLRLLITQNVFLC